MKHQRSADSTASSKYSCCILLVHHSSWQHHGELNRLSLPHPGSVSSPCQGSGCGERRTQACIYQNVCHTTAVVVKQHWL